MIAVWIVCNSKATKQKITLIYTLLDETSELMEYCCDGEDDEGDQIPDNEVYEKSQFPDDEVYEKSQLPSDEEFADSLYSLDRNNEGSDENSSASDDTNLDIKSFLSGNGMSSTTPSY